MLRRDVRWTSLMESETLSEPDGKTKKRPCCAGVLKLLVVGTIWRYTMRSIPCYSS
jgi:hypothetical protein